MRTAKTLVCVVDDDVSVRESVQGLLRQEGFQVEMFESAEGFLARPGKPPACLVVDLVLPGLSGLDLHGVLDRTGKGAPTILLTGHGDIPTSVRAIKAGAIDFLTKPYDVGDLLAAVRRAVSAGVRERTPGDLRWMKSLVGESEAQGEVLRQIDLVADSDATVLVTGESGTGKELVARAIHDHSRRSARHFVGVNCAAIPSALVASELFGHERGAFTGAVQRHIGRFEMAEGGTLFLDEVGDLPPETQIALLRVLQEREFERVGGGRPVPTDVRVIAATNRDLEAAVAVGAFRSDLFYRLNVVPIFIPPLRDRREDIPVLARHFAERFARQAGASPRPVSDRSMDLLLSYSWPGNVRELQNVIERAVILAEGESLTVNERWLHGPPAAQLPGTSAPATPTAAADAALPFVAQRRQREKALIEEALGETQGRVSGPSGAAARLGMPPSTLESRIRSLSIDKGTFRRVYAIGATSDPRMRV